MKKIFKLTVLLFLFFTVSTSAALAHVAVSPKEVNIGERVNFSVSVPNEKDVPTTALRLIIPEGLESVTPNVKPGWTITAVPEGDHNQSGDNHSNTNTKEIIWSGGSIPAGQRDEFIFRAVAPPAPETLIWKAYQTYADGTVVAWDINPDLENSSPDSGPYSKTNVIDDLSSNNDETQLREVTVYGPIVLSIIAIAISLFTLVKKRK